jgi:hypothetical protein
MVYKIRNIYAKKERERKKKVKREKPREKK